MDDKSELLKKLFGEQIQTELNLLIQTELDLLSQRVKAEQETATEQRRKNDLEAATLQVEKQRNLLWLEISERTANLVQQLPEMARAIYGYDEKLEQFPELIEELSERLDQRLDRIERVLVLLLSLVGEGNRQAKAISKSIEQEQQRRLIDRHKRRLDKLEEKRASYGLETPAHLLIEIEDLENKIKQLEEG